MSKLFHAGDVISIAISSIVIVLAVLALVVSSPWTRLFGFLFLSFACYNTWSLLILERSQCDCFPAFDPPIELVIVTDMTLSICWSWYSGAPGRTGVKPHFAWVAAAGCTMLSIAITGYAAGNFGLDPIEERSKLPESLVIPIESAVPELARQLRSGQTTRIILLRGNCDHCRELEKVFSYSPDTLAMVIHPESNQMPSIPAFEIEQELLLSDGSFPAMLLVHSGRVVSKLKPEQLIAYLDRTPVFY